MKKIIVTFLAAIIITLSVFPSFAYSYGTSALAGVESCISWDEARYHIGETATVKGKVVSSNYAYWSNGGPTFLNLGKPYPNSEFTVVIFEENRNKFSYAPESMYYGKTIEVTGMIKWYNTYAEIIVKDPSQIRIK